MPDSNYYTPTRNRFEKIQLKMKQEHSLLFFSPFFFDETGTAMYGLGGAMGKVSERHWSI
jgi:hypothetical protein